MKSLLRPRFLLPLLTLVPLGADLRADQLRIILESAPAPSGPWTREDLGQRDHDANGNPLLPMTAARRFYRSLIEHAGVSDPGAPLELAEVPAEFTQRAQHYLDAAREGEGGWGPDAEIAPCVRPIFDLAFNDGKTPAFLEFKLRRKAATARAGAFPSHNDDCLMMDLGFLLVALHEGEHPVPRCANSGLTLVEQLQCRAKTKLIKVFSFGGTFFTAEDGDGRALANLGQVPFKVDPALMETQRTDKRWTGDSETARDDRPAGLPRASAGGYPTLADFKTDYLTNPVYLKIRQRRAARARLEWDVERGQFPATINLRVGDSDTAFPGRTITEYHWDDEADSPLAAFSTPSGGGILINARAAGDGMLIALLDGQAQSVAVHITGAAGIAARGARAFTPGWQPWSTTILPGGYDDTPKYNQLQSDNWCPAVGCGPNALAMLAGYYDRHGVPAAFGNLLQSDAPANTSTAAARAILMPELDKMHDYCDVICPPFSDEGATLPGDEAEGILDYTAGPRFLHFLNMSWNMRWAGLFSTFDDGATETRTAILNGRPSVLGLGEYWHYVLAYGYRVREFKVTANGPVFLRERQLRCNMGWGAGSDPQWWGFYDTFFSSNVGMWKGPLAP